MRERGSLVPLRRLAILLVAAFAVVYGSLVSAASAAGVIPTDRGPVRGSETPAMKEYLGIPYAAPPVGDLRWRPPQPHARWHGPRDATHFANHCPQPGSLVRRRDDERGLPVPERLRAQPRQRARATRRTCR